MTTQKGNPRHNRQSDSIGSTSDPRRARSSRSSNIPRSNYSHQTSSYPNQTAFDRINRRSSRLDSGAYAVMRKKRKRKKVLLGVLAAVLVAVLAGGGAAFAYIMNINGNLQSGVDQNLRDALDTVDTPTDPFYMLLLGIDGSADREEDEFYEGDNFRSDSMMLARIDPQNQKATLVSIRRDVLIRNMGQNGEYGDQKVNAAHFLGGPALAVQTVSELAGVPIAHYAEINFDGFCEVVDTLGGIEVDVPVEIDDGEAGGYVAQGLQTLDGNSALTLCRSRHAYDDFGEGDNYRAANQRLVLAAIAEKLLSSDIGTIASTATAISKCITTDMSVTDIVAVAQSMHGMNAAEDIYSGVIPAPSAMIGDTWYDLVDEEEWKAMMARVDAGLPPNTEDIIDEATGTIMANTGNAFDSETGEARAVNADAAISLRNGNGITGITEQAAKLLRKIGYSDFDTGNANDFSYAKTVIVYKDSSSANDAKMIAKALGAGTAQQDDGEYLFESDVLVVLGSDFQP